PRPIPSRRVDTDGTGTAPGGGRAARRRAAAAETTVFDVPSYDVPSYGDAAYGDAAYGDAAYGDAAYGDAAYGDAAYGDAAYGDAAYGDAAYGDAAYGDAAYDDAAYDDRAYDDGPGEPVTELVDTRATGEQPTALVATGGRRRARPADDDLVDSGIDVLPGAGEDDEAPADAVSETGGRRAARRAAGKRRGLFRRRWPLLAAGVVVGVIGLTGIVLLNSGDAAPQPTAVVESAPVVPELPTASDASDGQDEAAGPSQGDPLSDRGSTFLSALREAGVPTSRGGAAETEAAELVCGELADGVDEARIARALPASLPTVTRAQAADLVEIAKENYCTS
ncbi:DUF732 domain-containing protein, partial [Pseudonocardia abyssalis]